MQIANNEFNGSNLLIGLINTAKQISIISKTTANNSYSMAVGKSFTVTEISLNTQRAREQGIGK